MGLIDKLKSKKKDDVNTQLPSTEETNADSYLQTIQSIMQQGKVGPNGSLVKVDMKRLKEKQVIELIKKNKSLDE